MNRKALAIIDALLRAPADPPRADDFTAWKRIWRRTVDAWEMPIDRAFMGGLRADRPAWALAAGYQAALHKLVPALPPEQTTAVCITESHGTHPSRMQCRLTAPAAGVTRWRLDGGKTFVTGAFLAWFFAVGRRCGWPDPIRESLLALMTAVRTLALAPPLDPHVHLAIGGVLSQVARLVDETEPLWAQVDSQTRQWRRDRRVLDIAAAVRSRRLETARAHFHTL